MKGFYWIVNTVDGKPSVFIQDATYPIFETAKKIPKKMIGRVLSAKEASALLKKMG